MLYNAPIALGWKFHKPDRRFGMADFVRIYTGNDGFTHFEDRDHQYEDPAAHGAPVAPGVSAISASAGVVDGAALR